MLSAQRLGLRFVFSTYCQMMPDICTKFHEEILNGLKVIERTRNIASNKQKGISISELKIG